jgi:hypothetical protein
MVGKNFRDSFAISTIELMKSAAIGGGKPVRRALQLDEQ